MTELKIWAPSATSVAIEIHGKREPMHPDADGHWMLNSDDLTHGTDYAVWLDDQGPFPDPRSAWQPAGVHGPSRWIDHGIFAWSDSNWHAKPFAEAILYELHIGTFTPEGTFAAAISRLDELVELGITHIEIMPVAEFIGTRGWGYDGVDLYAPHHSYGGPDGLKQLIDACHARGVGVVLDVVYNHLGKEGNYVEKFGPYFHALFDTPWGKAVNLDGAQSEHVRRFFIDNALMWLRDYHIDGLRLDAVHTFVDQSHVHFMAQLVDEIKTLGFSLGRNFTLIAESDLNDPKVVKPATEGGWGFDAQGNEDFHHALHTLLTGENFGYYRDFGNVNDLAKVLGENFCIADRYSEHRQRLHGRSAAGIESHRFIAFAQNHDQTGNRATGERIGHLVDSGRVKLAAAVTLLSPFVPMLFQGEEWSASSPFNYFADLLDPVVIDEMRQGRRAEFATSNHDPASIPDPLDEGTFRQSQLNWEERSAKQHHEILEWYKDLIRLRKDEPDFAPGPLDSEGVECDEATGTLSFRRGRYRVVCNFSAQSQQVLCSEQDVLELVMASSSAVELFDVGEVFMPMHSVAVLENVAEMYVSSQGG
ncbi:MAG: malto-oligosyltrehalose trehalohydrolase [Pseudomonadota bacterium]